MSSQCGLIQEALTKQITEALQPSVLQVINESYKHNVPKGSESHFKVLVVSEAFDGLAPLARHRLVNSAVKATIPTIHAFSVEAKTPAQYAASPTVAATPNCLGGSKS